MRRPPAAAAPTQGAAAFGLGPFVGFYSAVAAAVVAAAGAAAGVAAGAAAGADITVKLG